MTVFDNFENTPYTFLMISRGGVYGNRITAQTEATGVFKLRSGMNSQNNQETRQSDATLHIKPTESFLSLGRLVGHGIRKDGIDYEIVGETGGDDLETGMREHYRLTLQAADFSEYDYASS